MAQFVTHFPFGLQINANIERIDLSKLKRLEILDYPPDVKPKRDSGLRCLMSNTAAKKAALALRPEELTYGNLL